MHACQDANDGLNASTLQLVQCFNLNLQVRLLHRLHSVLVFFAAGIQSFKLDTTSLLLSVLTKFRFQISTLFIAEAVFYSSSIAIPLVYHQNTKAADTRCLSLTESATQSHKTYTNLTSLSFVATTRRSEMIMIPSLGFECEPATILLRYSGLK